MAAVAEVAAAPRDRIWDEIRELGLEKYVADMDHDGFCTLPPEIANPNNLAERMLDALVDLAEKRNGERPDLETGATHAYQPKFLYGAKNERYGRTQLKDQTPALKSPTDLGKEDSPFGDRMHSIFYEDPVFPEAMMNPPLLAMVTYLLGYSAVLSNMGCWMKGPCKSNFPLHTDCGGMPSPLPQQAYAAQCTYLLTDFSRENGATCLVPGSHRWNRNPIGNEKTLLPYEEGGKEQAAACDAPAGSIVIWHGNAWHGAFNRTAPGIRVSVTVYFCRQVLRPLEDFIGKVPEKMLEEMIDKYGPRFAMVLQQGCIPGYSTQGDRVGDTARAEKYIQAYEEAAGVRTRNKSDPYH